MKRRGRWRSGKRQSRSIRKEKMRRWPDKRLERKAAQEIWVLKRKMREWWKKRERGSWGELRASARVRRFSHMTQDWRLKSKPHGRVWLLRSLLVFRSRPFCFQLTFPHFCSLLGGPFLPFPVSAPKTTHEPWPITFVCVFAWRVWALSHQSSDGDKMHRWGAPIKISSIIYIFGPLTAGVATKNLKDPCTVKLVWRHSLYRCTKVLFTGKYFPELTYIVIIVVCAPPNWTITALNEALDEAVFQINLKTYLSE